MTTITGLTAERMLEIEAASVVDGDVVGNDLILARKDGSIINAGNLRGPAGPTGPMGSALSVVTAQQLLDVGQVGQIRAGRQLTPADFTNMGLSVPLGLWNLSNFNDSSGNARHLTNHGSVPLGVGIHGLASTSAVFAGSAAQSLYILDSGVNDPFRIKTGSWGCWFITSKRGQHQRLMSKMAAPGAITDVLFDLYVVSTNILLGQSFANGVGAGTNGTTDVADGRWHFAVVTADGSKIITYLDGVVEATGNMAGVISPSTFGPLNIGNAGDTGAGGIAGIQSYGRVSNAFVSGDVLSAENVRNLYCASIPHALGSVPSSINLSVRRRRRGSVLAVTDFPAQPARLYNFAAGSLADQGSNNTPLAPVGGGTIVDVGGADGLANGAKAFLGAHTGLGSTDAGLPAGLTSRSYGLWFKKVGVIAAAGEGIIGWGAPTGTADARMYLRASDGSVVSTSAADIMAGGYAVNDGLWHYVVTVEDNTPADGVKRKMYLDGRIVTGTTVLNSITVGTANRFRVGAVQDGSSPFTGLLTRAFVYAGALTAEQIRKLYDAGVQALAAAPKSAEDHVEAAETARLLATFDSLETNDLIDLAVMS